MRRYLEHGYAQECFWHAGTERVAVEKLKGRRQGWLGGHSYYIPMALQQSLSILQSFLRLLADAPIQGGAIFTSSDSYKMCSHQQQSHEAPPPSRVCHNTRIRLTKVMIRSVFKFPSQGHPQRTNSAK